MANESAAAFRQALKMKRLTMRPQDRKRIKKVPNWIYPKSKESSYYKEINKAVLSKLRNEVNETLGLNLQVWIDEKNINDKLEGMFNEVIKKDGGFIKDTIIADIYNEYKNIFKFDKKKLIRKDVWTDELRQLTGRLFGISTDIIGDPDEEPKGTEFGEILLIVAAGLYLFGNKQWKKQTESALGYEFRTSDPWWNDVRDSWINENVSLIRSVSDDYRTKVQETVSRGIRNGLSYKEITEQVKDVDEKVLKNRAKLIARDQIGKLNGQITKHKMEEVGLNIYEWLTAMDERVRGNPAGLYPKAIPSHFDMHGKLCKWSDDSVYANKSNPKTWMLRTGKMPLSIPGEEIQCRCTAKAYYDELINEIDEEIEEEVA